MESEAEYIERYSDFLRRIAAQMDGENWDFQEFRQIDFIESIYTGIFSGNTIVVEKTRIDKELNTDAFFRNCILVEASYRVKIPENYKLYGFWFVKCSIYWSCTEYPDLQYFTFLRLHY